MRGWTCSVRRPGKSNEGGPFQSFLHDLLGGPRKAPAWRQRAICRDAYRHAIYEMDDEAVRFIKHNGYRLWRRGTREKLGAIFSTCVPNSSDRAPRVWTNSQFDARITRGQR